MSVAERIDGFLLRKVFTPIAHMADYRLHRNNFDCAVWMFEAATVLVISDIAVMWSKHGWGEGVFVGMIKLLNAAIYTSNILRASRCSADYERRPDILPKEAAFFAVLPSALRLLMLTMPLFLSVPIIMSGALTGKLMYVADGIAMTWLFWGGCGYYFGMVPKPPARRKEQEANFGQMVPVRSR
jgi:hypothetical protein